MEDETCWACDGPVLDCGGCPNCDGCDESNCMISDEE